MSSYSDINYLRNIIEDQDNNLHHDRELRFLVMRNADKEGKLLDLRLPKHRFSESAPWILIRIRDYQDNGHKYEIPVCINCSPTEYYPNHPLFRHPKKYSVSNQIDRDFCEKNFDSSSDFCPGIFSIGKCLILYLSLSPKSKSNLSPKSKSIPNRRPKSPKVNPKP